MTIYHFSFSAKLGENVAAKLGENLLAKQVVFLKIVASSPIMQAL